MPTESPTKDNLNQSLHPEWIKSRMAPYGKKQFYLQGHNAIKLANEVFGRDGWTREIKHSVVDFYEVSEDGSVMVAMAVTVRVTLVKTGSFHEDTGYGTGEHATTKSIAMEKARFAAAFDGMKRALRKFGNATGNCLYDTNYLQHVDSSVAPPPTTKTMEQLPPLSTVSVTMQHPHLGKRHPPTTTQQQPTSVSLTTCTKNEALQVARTKKQKAPATIIHPIKKEPLDATTPQQPSTTLRPIKKESQSSSTTMPCIKANIGSTAPPPPTMTGRTKTNIEPLPPPPPPTVTPLSLMTRIKPDNNGSASSSLSRLPPPPPSSSLDTYRPGLVAQDSFPFDEQDEAWFIQTTEAQTNPQFLQRTCRENSHPNTKSSLPCHH